jgi:hypothetical protein
MTRNGFMLLSAACAVAGSWIGHSLPNRTPLDSGRSKNGPAPMRTGKETGRMTVKYFADVKSGPQRAALILGLAESRDSSRLPALIEAWSLDANSVDDPMSFELLADIWLKVNPAALVAAMAGSQAMEGSQRKRLSDLLVKTISRWSLTDEEAAWKSADMLSGSLRDRVRGQLARERVARDPQKGLAFVLQKRAVPVFISENVIPENSPQLLPAIRQLPDCDAKSKALYRAVAGMPLKEALSELGSPREQATIKAREVVLTMAAKKSLDEVKAFHQQASGSARYAAASAIADALKYTDPAAAVEWARVNLSGPAREQTIQAAVGELKSIDPEKAEAARALLPESYKRSTVR